MSNVQKAYQSGYRMGKYIMERDGLERAISRGSLARFRYPHRTRGLIGAYDRGYRAALGILEELA
jgi:hypothetical protein